MRYAESSVEVARAASSWQRASNGGGETGTWQCGGGTTVVVVSASAIDRSPRFTVNHPRRIIGGASAGVQPCTEFSSLGLYWNILGLGGGTSWEVKRPQAHLWDTGTRARSRTSTTET